MKTDIKPPRFPERLFDWYCGSSVAEDLMGDMEEVFYQNLSKMSIRKASRKYWFQSLSLLFSYGLKRRKQKRNNLLPQKSFNGFDVFQNYSKVAIRSLVKQKFFTIINVLGLSIGMSIGLLALAAYMDMLEVDQFQKNGENIYRVLSKIKNQDGKRTYASSSGPLAGKLKNEASGIKDIVRINTTFNPEIRTGNTTIPLQGYYADQSFLNVFSFTLLEGDINTALEKPYSMIITETAAKKLFSSSNPVGKIITVDGVGDFQITGLIKDYPRSHFLFESVASWTTLEDINRSSGELENWGPITNNYTYIHLENKVDFGQIQEVLNEADILQFGSNESINVQFELQNILDIHKTDYYNEIGMIWGTVVISIFFAMAFWVL